MDCIFCQIDRATLAETMRTRTAPLPAPQNLRALRPQWSFANFVRVIDPYPSPRRLSGHQLFENGRSGYAEEEDHE